MSVNFTQPAMPPSVRIVEVAPRDGLQNESQIIGTAEKVQFIKLLAASGLDCIEATSFVGEGADTLVFITLAFGVTGIFSSSQLLTAILVQWAFKVLYEVAATPFTYLAVGYLKRKESLDTYDRDTNFSPVIFGTVAARS